MTTDPGNPKKNYRKSISTTISTFFNIDTSPLKKELKIKTNTMVRYWTSVLKIRMLKKRVRKKTSSITIKTNMTGSMPLFRRITALILPKKMQISFYIKISGLKTRNNGSVKTLLSSMPLINKLNIFQIPYRLKPENIS